MKQRSLSWSLTRALLPWVALVWVAISLGVAWYVQRELAEQLDAGLVESAERLLDLAAHDARNHEKPSERDGTLCRLEVPHSKLHGAKHDVLLYQVVNTDNELLLRSADAPRYPLPVPLSTGFREYAGLRIYTLAHPSLPMYIHAGDPHLKRALFDMSTTAQINDSLKLGGAMLRHVEAKTRELGRTRLYLTVNKGNAGSIAVYLKSGFVVREEAVFDIGNGYLMDDYVMEKRL